MPNWKKIIVSGSDAVLNNVTASGAVISGSLHVSGNILPDSDNVWSLGTTDNRFQLNGGTPVTVTGSGVANHLTRFNAATSVETASIFSSDTQTRIVHSNDNNVIFTVSGSNGELLTVTDDNSGNLLEVNDTSGITVFEVDAIGNVTASGIISASGVNLTGDVQFLAVTGSDFTGSFTGSALLISASIGHLETIYETASVIYSSGSTKFGDTSDDTHEITGSLLVTGSINGDGSSLYENITVTVVNDGGNKYAFNGITAPNLSVQNPSLYRFDLSDSSNSGHPFAFRLPDDTSYTIGVTTVGTAGNTGAYVELDIDFNASSSLKYYCTVHGNGMGNDIQINDLFDLRASGSFSGSFEGDGTNLTGVASPTGSYTGSFTGSILGDVIGTASIADNATTASIADLATTASYISTASFADSATTASHVVTASFADNATTASHVVTASFANNATTASQADNATTASHVLTASFADSATSASIADSLSQLATASHALTSVTSSHTAGTASFSNRAITASQADNATTASHVVTASFSNNSTTASFPERGFIDGTVNNNIITLNRGDGTSIDLETTVSGSVESASIASIATLARGGSGSFSGSFQGDGSEITGISPFPFTGSGEMQGTLTVESFNDYVDDYVESYFAGTAINASGDIALTGSIFSPYINADGFTGSLSGSFTGSGIIDSASLAETASYFNGTVTSASLAETASFYGGSVTSASLAETASHVVTASFADMATTASYGFDMTASSLRVEGTASIVYLESVYETASVIYSSGSTKFGDDTSDTHERTGSVDISGSLTVEGSASLVVSQSVNNNTASGSLSFWQGSQAEYDLVSASADDNTIYFVVE